MFRYCLPILLLFQNRFFSVRFQFLVLIKIWMIFSKILNKEDKKVMGLVGNLWFLSSFVFEIMLAFFQKYGK